MKCAICNEKECEGGKDCTGIRTEILGKYKGENYRIFRVAGEIEARHYMKKTRLEEIILFGKQMGYRCVGLAFCIGFEKEATLVHKILEKHFTVVSVCCKVCGIGKSKFGLRQLRKKGFEASCNPIGQAKILNKSKTELNIIMGLCVGHDSLFIKHSRSPVTVFAVKDRVLAHNPLGAIYSNYYLEKVFGINMRWINENPDCI